MIWKPDQPKLITKRHPKKMHETSTRKREKSV